MSRIGLKELNLKGYQTFVADAYLEFPDNGVVLINGENLDTKGSSGSGKTNLVGAIAYLLDYSDLPATELKSWHADEMEVSGTISTEKGVVKIHRGTTGLRVEISSTEIKGSTAEKELQKLHGLPPAFLEPMTYRPQQKPGKPSGGFLGMGPSDKAKFLSRLLDLDKFEAEFEKAKKATDTIEAKYDSLREAETRAAVEMTSAEIAATSRSLDYGVEDAASALAILNTQLSEVKKRIEKAEQDRDQAQAKETVMVRQIQKDFVGAEEIIRANKPDTTDLQEKLTACVKHLVKAEQEDGYAKQQFLLKISALKKEIHARNTAVIAFGNVEERLEVAEKALAQIRSMVCNVCKRPWDGPEQQSEGERLDALIGRLRIDMEAKQDNVSHIGLLTLQADEEYQPGSNVGRLTTIKQKLEKEIAVKEGAWKSDQSAALMSLRAAQRTAMEQVTSASSAISNTIMKLRSIGNKLALTVSNAEKRLAVAEERTRSEEQVKAEKTERVNRARNSLLDIKLKADATAKEMAEEKDFAALIGRTGYLGVIFDEVLQDISQRASSIMSMIPNVSHCSIKLSPVKTTKTGERKAITPVIYINGVERPFQSCSGGMTNAITLSVDLALSQVISERTGTRLGWMILDECFDGMDLPTKEACIELLRDTAETEDLLIFVIDHDTSLKEMFDKVITIKFQDGKSWIETRYSDN